MKKHILSTLAICAALFGCQKNEVYETQSSDIDLHATIEDNASTKTVLDENNNIRWSEGDQIVAFMKSSLGLKYQVAEESVGKTSARFVKKVNGNSDDLYGGTDWNHNVVYYPYSEAVEAAKSGVNYILDVVLPAEQTYAPESFGNGSMAMVAVSEDNNITFKNVCGGMKLQLKGAQKVVAIKLEGKNSEKLSGAATVTAYTDGETKPAITMASGASTSVTLNCGTGVQLNEATPTEFIITLPPVLFSKGFTVVVNDVTGLVYTIDTDKCNEVKRSSVLIMPEVILDANHRAPLEGDYIDEYGINHGQGVEVGETIWAPVNCGYHKNDFKYGKLYQWGRKYGQGYHGEFNDSLDNVIGEYSDTYIPEIVEGPVSLALCQSEDNAEKLLYPNNDYFTWLEPPFDNLWNAGTEENPVKTEYDPCPKGWRVPTYVELEDLIKNYSSASTDPNALNGLWLSGANAYTESVPQVFFSAAGLYSGQSLKATGRGYFGRYWTSMMGLRTAGNFMFSMRGTLRMYEQSHVWAYSVRCVRDESELIPVASVILDHSSLTLANGESNTLVASISPVNANHQAVYWWSDDTSVATVDQNGNVTAVSTGTATITAMAGMQTTTCEIIVPISSDLKDYVDEYSENHGFGIEIGGVVWAPVNCGYHKDYFKYGKLYQWGRKYGQGYCGYLYESLDNDNVIGEYSDKSVPEIVSGSVSLDSCQSEGNKNKFYCNSSWPYDWSNLQNDNLWNDGTEDAPIKTKYDPCPAGWRVPTSSELRKLPENNCLGSLKDGQNGVLCCTKVFFPAAGSLFSHDGTANFRGRLGCYWSSSPNPIHADCLSFTSIGFELSSNDRATGYSVRCVQE